MLFITQLKILAVNLNLLKAFFEDHMVLLRAMTPKHDYHHLDSASHTEVVSLAGVGIAHLLEKNSKAWLVSTDGLLTDCLHLACFFHDVGKTKTWNPEGSPWFPKHESVGADMLTETGWFEVTHNGLFEGVTPEHPVVSVVRHHGWARCMNNGDSSVKDKTFRKFVKKLHACSESNIPITGYGYVKETSLSQWEMVLMYACLLLADSKGFSEVGERLAQEQLITFCLKYDELYTDTPPLTDIIEQLMADLNPLDTMDRVLQYNDQREETLTPLDVAPRENDTDASQSIEDLADDYMSPDGEGRDDHMKY